MFYDAGKLSLRLRGHHEYPKDDTTFYLQGGIEVRLPNYRTDWDFSWLPIERIVRLDATMGEGLMLSFWRCYGSTFALDPRDAFLLQIEGPVWIQDPYGEAGMLTDETRFDSFSQGEKLGMRIEALSP